MADWLPEVLIALTGGAAGYFYQQVLTARYQRVKQRIFDCLDSLLPDRYQDQDLERLIALLARDLGEGFDERKLFDEIYHAFRAESWIKRKSKYAEYLEVIRK